MSSHCWGIFRERAHSPGRENDDTEILRLTGKHLEARGYQVDLKDPEDVSGPIAARPRAIFLMCEREEVLAQLTAWERDGIRIVNSPAAVLATYRERMIAQFDEAGVPFVTSRLVATPGRHPGAPALPVWVKRGDVHNTQEGDVVFAETEGAVEDALGRFHARGIARAVLQPHVAGDLIKFYGVGPGGGPDGGPPWFRWFYHKDQTLAGIPSTRDSSGTSPGGRRARSGSRSTAVTPSRRRMAASCSSTSTRGRASPSTEKRRRPPSPRRADRAGAEPSRTASARFDAGRAPRPSDRGASRPGDSDDPASSTAARGRAAVEGDRGARAAPHRAGLSVLRALLRTGDGARPGLDAHRRGRQRVPRLHRRASPSAASGTAIRTTSTRSSARSRRSRSAASPPRRGPASSTCSPPSPPRA